MDFFTAGNLNVDVRADGIALLRFDVPGRSHNVFNRQVLIDLSAALDRLIDRRPPPRLLVLYSGKPRGFFAGADLHEFTAVRTPQDAVALSEAGQQVFDRLARLPTPSVAVIHGPCLGGGLELALACDYRVVLDQPGTQLGLPEIELGLIPGWGGTQRLPRVVGLERALRVILMRHRLNPRQALQWGLADTLGTTPEAFLSSLPQTAGGWADRGKRARAGPPLRTWRQRLLESTFLGRALVFRGATHAVRRRVPDDMPAPLEALNALRVGLTRGMVEGLRAEREAIGRLAVTPACRNLVSLFFLMERARKGNGAGAAEEFSSGVDPAASSPQVRRVGVVGAGTMGAGIAQLAAAKGFDVVVQEVNDGALAAGMNKIKALFDKAVERRLLSPEEARRKLDAVGRTTTWEGFSDVDLAIEAVVEDLDKKRDVFSELDRRTRPTTFLATNTSSLSVKALQEGLAHPDRVAGLHFFNPVHKMPLVEVVRSPATGEAAVAALARWAAALGKTPVVVGDSPGFLVNRVLMPYLSEAGRLVSEGLPVRLVDAVMRRFGMPVGPLELLDQVGLDVAAHIARSMAPLFGDRLAAEDALERMCRQGWLGQKSGAGFYRYRGRRKSVNRAAAAVLPVAAQRTGGAELSDLLRKHVIRDRMVLPMVNEAAACLGEGVALTAEVVDLAMVLGTGWAPHRGGPLRYADDRGPADVVKTLEDLAAAFGPRFAPCPELRRRAGAGERFYGAVGAPS